jgi:hypothetical protein
MHTATLSLSKAQTWLVRDLIESCPWWNRSHGCLFDDNTFQPQQGPSKLTFQFVPRTRATRATIPAAKAWVLEYEASDHGRLIEITYAAQKLGWPLRTCEAFRGKLNTAARKETERLEREAA